MAIFTEWSTYSDEDDPNVFVLTSYPDPKFSGAFYLEEGGYTYIKKVLYNNPVTVVFWSDGTKTLCKCSKEDIYSKETGLSICVLKKLIGSSNTRKLFYEWLPENDKNLVSLKDVRAKYKK